MFEGQPKGLYALALANTGERFGYYTMLAVFVLFLQENFQWDSGFAGTVYGAFLGLVYFLPLVGGILADKFGYGKMVTTGITIMFVGYLLLALPLGSGALAIAAMAGALLLIAVGTGLFKGNLQVMVGELYNNPELAGKRDSAFSLFYMAINVGSLFAPTAALAIMDYAQNTLGYSSADSYHFAFVVACISLIVSISIYFACRPMYRHVEGGAKKAAVATTDAATESISPEETKQRIVALCLVFAVVIFFWMSFHQNGLTLTYFARDYNVTSESGVRTMLFSVWNLVAIIIAVYGAFSVAQSKTANGKLIGTGFLVAAIAWLGYQYMNTDASTTVAVSAPIFQQFNPFYVVALTPVSLAIFGWLAKKGKEPSAPRKIALGMLVAAVGFVVILIPSFNLLAPDAQAAAIEAGQNPARVSSDWLLYTYLVLTFAELLLSPMGISFVSKVAPPQYKGMMMGGWFVATAIGNFLVAIPAMIWGKTPLWVVWATLVALCLISYVFLSSQMKKLEKVA
ncbi:MAG: peptide MFS transporter [Bacteroidaceae bacterium]|nr:peptide MFS transporter [Bacteroidaceae bacterium]